MSGLKGFIREPSANPRARRNSVGLSSSPEFVDPSGVIRLDSDGQLTLALDSDSGLGIDGQGELTIKLQTDPGLVLGATGVAVLLQGVLSKSVAGIQVNIGEGLENDGSDNLRVKIKSGGGLVRDGDGLSVAAVAQDPGIWDVTSIQTGAYTAALRELVRCDPSGGVFPVTLPTAVGATGEQVAVKNVTASVLAITVQGDGGETIDGSASFALTLPYESATLVSEGAGWSRI